MKNIQKIVGGVMGSLFVFGILASGTLSVHAQQTATTGQTPVFYNQNGTATNPNGTEVPAGNYYNQQGQQVYYYGNGTYYNSSTGQYGGTAYTGTTNNAAPGVPYSVTTATGNGNGTTNTTSTYGNTNSTTMAGSAATGGTPVFYQNGTAVNPNGTTLPAGNYNLQSGQQVYYYGNGTYYDPSTGQYGGQLMGTTAMSGTSMTSGTMMTPGAPNTGAGGDATYTILGVAAALIVAGAGMAYLTRTQAELR